MEALAMRIVFDQKGQAKKDPPKSDDTYRG